MSKNLYVPRLRVLIDKGLYAKFQRAYYEDDKTGCWVWMACCTSSGKGYPVLCTGGDAQMSAHRYSLQIKEGRVLSRKELACHTCDNKKCVNPEHLFVGSQLDNVRDKLRKGRHSTRYVSRIFTDEQVRFIRRECLYDSQQNVANKFGVCRGTIVDIIERRSYKDVR